MKSKQNNGFLKSLGQSVSKLIGIDEKSKEIKEFKRNQRCRHIDFIIKNINKTIKHNTTFEEITFMREFLSDLNKLKNKKTISTNELVYRDYEVNIQIIYSLEYLANRHGNLVVLLNNKSKDTFKKTLELKVIEELQDSLIPLLKKY